MTHSIPCSKPTTSRFDFQSEVGRGWGGLLNPFKLSILTRDLPFLIPEGKFIVKRSLPTCYRINQVITSWNLFLLSLSSYFRLSTFQFDGLKHDLSYTSVTFTFWVAGLGKGTGIESGLRNLFKTQFHPPTYVVSVLSQCSCCILGDEALGPFEGVRAVTELSVVEGNVAVVPCSSPFSRPKAVIEFEHNGTRIPFSCKFSGRLQGPTILVLVLVSDFVLVLILVLIFVL